MSVVRLRMTDICWQRFILSLVFACDAVWLAAAAASRSQTSSRSSSTAPGSVESSACRCGRWKNIGGFFIPRRRSSSSAAASRSSASSSSSSLSTNGLTTHAVSGSLFNLAWTLSCAASSAPAAKNGKNSIPVQTAECGLHLYAIDELTRSLEVTETRKVYPQLIINIAKLFVIQTIVFFSGRTMVNLEPCCLLCDLICG